MCQRRIVCGGRGRRRSRGNVVECNERAACPVARGAACGRPGRGGRARGRNASFSHREKRMRLSVAGTQWRRDEIRFAGGAGAGAGALIDSRRATAGRLRRIGDSSGPIKLPAVEESCSATHAGETQAAAARRPRVRRRRNCTDEPLLSDTPPHMRLPMQHIDG